MPERRWWRLKLRGLAAAHNWAALHEFATSTRKGPPIGLQPFIDACVAQNAPEQAARYVALLPTTEGDDAQRKPSFLAAFESKFSK